MKADNFELIKVLYQFPETEEALYRKELCIVDWFGKGPKYDIRGWNKDHTKMTKGISLTEEEFRGLVEFGKLYLEGGHK